MSIKVFEATLLPAAFCATTEQVYWVLLVRPVTLIGEAAALAKMPPGLQVAR